MSDSLRVPRLESGSGKLDTIGAAARACGMSRALIVADRGIVAAGFVERATLALEASGVTVCGFHDFGPNPDTTMVEAGRVRAAADRVDGIVAIGGGSSLDCAKGINFVLTNGGSMRDYRGHGKASKPMLPSIGVPTTSGTGSEASGTSAFTTTVASGSSRLVPIEPKRKLLRLRSNAIFRGRERTGSPAASALSAEDA